MVPHPDEPELLPLPSLLSLSLLLSLSPPPPRLARDPLPKIEKRSRSWVRRGFDTIKTGLCEIYCRVD